MKNYNMILMKKQQKYLTGKSNKYAYDFRIFQIIRTFGEDIYDGQITFEEADEYQSNLLNSIRNFKNEARPQNNTKENKKKKLFLKTRIIFLRVEKKFLMLLKVKCF